MKFISYKCFLLSICCFLFSEMGLYSQCKMEFFKEKGDTLFFYSHDITDSLKCSAQLYLTYSKKDSTTYYGYHLLSKVEIVGINLKKKINNEKISSAACSDTTNKCICDTLEKYLNSYYRNPNTMPKSIQLTTLDKYKYYHGDVKISINSPVIYIYPYRKK